MSGFLIDTDVLSNASKPRPDRHVADWLARQDESSLFMSVLTLGEFRQGIEQLSKGDAKRRRYEILLTELAARFRSRMLTIDAVIAERWGRLRGHSRTSGRDLPVIDSLIAATALHHNLIVVTRNARDYLATGVTVLNPFEKI